MVVLLPAYWMGWTVQLSDSRHLGESLLGTLAYLAIPAAVASLPRMASVMRMTRAALLEILGLEYVRTAWAKGLSHRRVVWRHALGNVLIPIVSVMGLQMAAIVGEIVIIENIFNVPGMGRLIVESIFQRDYPMLQGAALLTAVFITILNFLVDVSYLYFDPRVRYA
jgi:ABC-type dipeptide/oligopeptide/nickel transport system permease component